MRPQTQHYQDLLVCLDGYLFAIGYADRRLDGVREFLRRMEQSGVRNLQSIETAHIKAHYAYLQTRPSRWGGVLSPHTIIGYLY